MLTVAPTPVDGKPQCGGLDPLRGARWPSSRFVPHAAWIAGPPAFSRHAASRSRPTVIALDRGGAALDQPAAGPRPYTPGPPPGDRRPGCRLGASPPPRPPPPPLPSASLL